ncbi:hypothetical protein PIB30_022087 [Stylosanthes scabra]|uniref:Uncharacterized protein n=1 Tax=Stylosanthes scabra TaxID=79078 RepID=A0ABU6R9D9_9FABA|nr:hypothetical protein [Stylosanthes scabra]
MIVGDGPLLEKPMNVNLENVLCGERDDSGDLVGNWNAGKTVDEVTVRSQREGDVMDWTCPHEKGCETSQPVVQLVNQMGEEDLVRNHLFGEVEDKGGNVSYNSCPYTPGFGPCGNGAHAHNDMMVQTNEVNVDPNTGVDPKPRLIIDFSSYSQVIDVVEPQTHECGEIEKTRKLFEEGGLVFHAGCEGFLAKNLDSTTEQRDDQ